MNAPSSNVAATGSPQRPTVRPTRCFAVTYFERDTVLHQGRQPAFRSKRLNRAKRIARFNMPDHADRMELVEISFSAFNRQREAYRSRLG